MADKKVSIDELADAISEGLQEYADLSDEEMKAAVDKTAKEVKAQIQAGAPVKTGTYKKSWSTKATTDSSHARTVTVYSRNRAGLTHLLEKGHANRGGGRTRAYPHIAPAEQAGNAMIQELIKKALEG